MLQFDFMRNALLAGLMLAVVVPCIGVVVVLRRMSMVGDALSHSSLAGVAAGLLLGIDPLLGALAACLVAALCMEGVRRRMPQYGELAIAIVLSASVGLAGVLSGQAPGNSFSSYLFGSIVLVSNFELLLIAGVSAAVLAAFLLLGRALLAICFDERAARLAGVPVGPVQLAFTAMTALSVAVASRTVGALVVSSLMVLPVTCAMQLGRGYKHTVLCSVLFGLGFTLAGLTVSFYADLRPGSTIVLVGVACLVVILLAKGVRGRGGVRA